MMNVTTVILFLLYMTHRLIDLLNPDVADSVF